MAKTIYVSCSFCHGMMEVDASTGAIVQKWEPDQKGGGPNQDKMTSALKKLEDQKKRRENLFSQKKEEMEGQKKKIENSFQKEVDRVKKEGVKENPLRPFDLD